MDMCTTKNNSINSKINIHNLAGVAQLVGYGPGHQKIADSIPGPEHMSHLWAIFPVDDWCFSLTLKINKNVL